MAKRALLCGINDYKQINDLRGCHNDVTNMRDVLKTYFGFENTDIRILLDERATRKNILDRMNWMKEGSVAGDKLVFHFSGHGSQIRDRDGDELRDHKDEILCCYGMNWDEGYILDDEFDTFFKNLSPGVICEVFFDSCHSGTGQSVIPKEMDSRPALTEEPDVVGRYLPPPLDIELRSEGDDLDTNKFSEVVSPETFQAIGPYGLNRHIIWSGCGEAQTSADAFINRSFNGAFTYYFCKIIRENKGNINRVDVLKQLRSSLKHNRYTQIPELTCHKTLETLNLLT